MGYNSKFTGAQVDDLLERHIVPTLSSAPTEQTKSFVYNNNITVNFKIGDLCRVHEDEDYKFYRLINITSDNLYIWRDASGGGGDLYEAVSIYLSSNQSGSDSSLNGSQVIIKDVTDAEPTVLLDTTWGGQAIVFKVLAGTIYEVSFSEIEGYQKPNSLKYTAKLSSTRDIRVTYNTCLTNISITGLENGSSAKATVTYGSKSFTVSSGGSIKVPFGTSVKVSAPTINFHIKPNDVSFTPNTTTKSITLAYTASKVRVGIFSNQSSDSTISSVKATVSYGSTSTQVSNGGIVYIPHDQTVTVTYPAVSGYKTPSAVTINNTSGGQATASGTYQTEVVTVTVNAEDSSSVAGQKVTINGNVFTLDSTGVCTSKVPFDVQYSVSADAKSGYTSPATQTFTASQASRAVSMTYETIKLGVFIQDKSGKLWTTDQWSTANNANANAIAVLTENVKVLVALTNSGGLKQIHSSYSGALENYMTAIGDTSQAKADYKGKENTANIIKLQSSTSYAAGWANAFTFPDGTTKGHLPSLGEFWEVYQNKAAVDAALSKCGGTAINTSFYLWCSTFWGVSVSDRRNCWILDWSDGRVSYDDLRSSNYVRPFAECPDNVKVNYGNFKKKDMYDNVR